MSDAVATLGARMRDERRRSSAPLTRLERRAALIAALTAGPEDWVARELAETLARVEYREGFATARALERARARIARHVDNLIRDGGPE